ncbi:EAL domain-containing protein [Aestuariibacter sp. AA17]|uniref:EAL domain-containing protein n=1 Tax=Fluctibacter corallii TaxID=2984329 RepID=A0ABT3A5E3_9ALTE|nr:EAL domain-containing protein [Aestuariibacter sp. AA17]MCV2883900.1 EAL domain-containing protein [Aestuariibacter sp. AA17]
MQKTKDLSVYSAAFSVLSEPILVVDNQRNVVAVNPAFCNHYGISEQAVSGISLFQLVKIDILEGEKDVCNAQGSLLHASNWCSQAKFIKDAMLPLIVTLSYDPIFHQNHLIGAAIRFIEQPSIAHSESLHDMAYRDELTGLANRALFNQLLEHEISQSLRDKKRFALLFIDLDKFKEVNDSLGHDGGDSLLCVLADRMRKTLRKSDVVARLGGDEFVVIMHDVKDSDTMANVVEKVIRQVKKPVSLGHQTVQVGCSVGISIFPDNGVDAQRLMHHADVAMYRAKHQGGANYYYFSDELNKELKNARLMEMELRQALTEKQFVPYFQPLLDHRTQSLVGIECLTRWHHPDKGILEPVAFLPIAKRIGLMSNIMEQVLETAFGHLREWHKTLQSLVPLSVNLTSKQFYQSNTFDLLSNLLARHALPKDAICIEVTESTLQDNGDNLVNKIKEWDAAGFSITLDDFGTGYSSLRYLQHCSVNLLKIDRSFVRNIDVNPHDRVIVQAIIQLAHTLGIEAIAEGVETQSQQAFLLDNQCYVMQGHLYSPAVTANAFTEYLDTFTLKAVL